jgi:hypothetical protein
MTINKRVVKVLCVSIFFLLMASMGYGMYLDYTQTTIQFQNNKTDTKNTSSKHIKCAEDDWCWNCHTMGNRKCGPK